MEDSKIIGEFGGSGLDYSLRTDHHHAYTVSNPGNDGACEIWTNCSCGWRGVTVNRVRLEDEIYYMQQAYQNFYKVFGPDNYQGCSKELFLGSDALGGAILQLLDHTGVDLRENFDAALAEYENNKKIFEADYTDKAGQFLTHSIEKLKIINMFREKTLGVAMPKLPTPTHEALDAWSKLSNF